MTRMKESVAVVIRNADGEFLVTRRPDDPADPLAGLWGLPAVTRRQGETGRAAARRIGPLKLGVTLSIGAKLGERTADRDDHVLRLEDYEASIIDGTPVVPQPGGPMTEYGTVTQYVACRFTKDAGVLAEAARKGSLCAQIFLAAAGRDWR
jgi:8-oxo-dGTP diphosphatase